MMILLCLFVELGARCARHEFDRRGSRLGAHDVADGACGVAAVLGAVRGVDLVVDVVDCVHEGDVFLDAGGPDRPWWRTRVPRNQAAVRPLTDRT